MSGPIVACHQNIGDDLADTCRAKRRQAEEYDTAARRQTGAPGEFTEVLVESQEHASIFQTARKDILIGDARRIGPDPEYIVTCGAKCDDRIARKVFIRKKPHRQAIAAGYTFSDCNISLAYCRHAAMSSCVIPG